MIEPPPNRRRADFTVSHYDREAVDEEHQDARRGTPTTQSDGSQEAITSMRITMPPTTSSIRTTPSSRWPDSPMSRPEMTPSSTTHFTSVSHSSPPAETI